MCGVNRNMKVHSRGMAGQRGGADRQMDEILDEVHV